jgi:uncharacterized protein
MKFKRRVTQQFNSLMQQYPVVTVMGPRQSGKTTLVKMLCPDYPYISLEDPDIRDIAVHDPRSIFDKYPDKLIIDEVQRVPSLLSYIQTIVDEKQRDGMYVLTGSHQPALHEAMSQSLAGRTATLELLPLSLSELGDASVNQTLNERLLNGGFPKIYQRGLDPTQFYRDYVKTYVERDVRQLVNVKDLLLFQRFMKLCASRTGRILNSNNLASEVGVSSHTIKSWLSILQASYLIQLVSPYYENFGKQAIKSPKLYFTDVGLACYLLEIESLSQVDRDPLRGSLFETMVVTELLKSRLNQGRDPHLYFYRDRYQHEVDVIYKAGATLIPMEIKISQTVNRNAFAGLEYFRSLAKTRCGRPYFIYAGEQEIAMNDVEVLNYKHVHRVIDE